MDGASSLRIYTYQPEPSTATHIYVDGDVVGLWALPPNASVNEIRGAVGPKQPGVVVLLKSDRRWREPVPARLESHNVLTLEHVADVQAALLETARVLGKLDHYYRTLAQGDTIDIAFLVKPSQLEEALLLAALNESLLPWRDPAPDHPAPAQAPA